MMKMMETVINENRKDDPICKAAQEFVSKNLGNPDTLGKKIAAFAVQNLAKDGNLDRTDYDSFCYQVLSEINQSMLITGIMLTKFE
jgi:hypothetical protein